MSDRLTKLTKLHQADPRDPFLTYGIALEHGKLGAYDEAITWLDRTLEADAKYCYAYFQKAKMLEGKGDSAAAVQVLKHGIAAAQKAGDGHAAEEMTGLMETIEQ
ncbi:MAG: hypothetical protein WD768_10060 [Phycisphaeraceae bacterium]